MSTKESVRVRIHLARALRRIQRSAYAPSRGPRAKRRAHLLRVLATYIERERYPINRTDVPLTPIFVDASGTRCAVGEMIAAAGERELVARIAKTRNLARIRELTDDAELGVWLREHGLTAAEAAAIQPAYDNHVESHWEPTAAIVAEVAPGLSSGGGRDGVVPEVDVAPIVRAGVRRASSSDGACDHCVYGSVAVMGEYARRFTLGRGSTNQLGVLAQWEPMGLSSRDFQFYGAGGPFVLVLGTDDPKARPGGQLALGFSRREMQRYLPHFHRLPLLIEAVGQAFLQRDGVALRVGLNVGLTL